MTAQAPTDFASFWHGGPLHAFAWACLASFPDEGAALSLYSYDLRLEVPSGVRLLDARTICPDETLVQRYLANGKPSIATFADMFRYRMIRETGVPKTPKPQNPKTPFQSKIKEIINCGKMGNG